MMTQLLKGETTIKTKAGEICSICMIGTWTTLTSKATRDSPTLTPSMSPESPLAMLWGLQVIILNVID